MVEVEASIPCRSCGQRLIPFLSLGRTALANALLTTDQLSEPEETYRLDLALCPGCSLVQIIETVPPEKIFRDYFYLSSFSDTMVKHGEKIANELIASRPLGSSSLVVEVASNDGYLLQFYKRAGIPVLGIEPARNIAAIAQAERDIPTICDFFGEKLALRLSAEGKNAAVIHANNVLAHVADLNGVVRGFATLLDTDGILVVEVPYIREMIARCEFDTIYHEHLCYFSLTSLSSLFRRHGMIIQDVERLPIHGGTLRIFAVVERGQSILSDRIDAKPAPRVAQLLQEEADWGVNELDTYQGFGKEIERLKLDLVTLLRELKAQGKHIAVYGASAKGSTLLNYFGLGKETFDFLVDRSTVKQGHYTPGTHLRIDAPGRLLTEMPDYVLLLTWNFADEIMEQQHLYRERGGHFIIPIPEVKIV
jgi:SAM-dependent methyltransferase